MGTYYAAGLNVKLKPETPEAFLAFFRALPDRKWADRDQLTEDPEWTAKYGEVKKAFLEAAGGSPTRLTENSGAGSTPRGSA